MLNQNSPIHSFEDLTVYQDAYRGMVLIAKHILPRLPAHERFDLGSQLSRSSKSAPRLISEGYAKRHQKAGFQKYLDDTLAESNETKVSLMQARDLYGVLLENPDLIDLYDKISRQVYNLSASWGDARKKRYSSDARRNVPR